VNLKKIDIVGFKSFANKTTVHFSDGITAIVGPNGCGKTNILDAIRWVLGEQKVTLLRSSKMEEVIFNGSRDVKPLGMAEVTISFINNRGVLPTEYNEIQITRRLFRSGESEYLLNKVPCRLKDITELFYDTGVGAHSYSVIQQDMIEAVISDKAEERRFLFEEASGITKYKQRKKAAIRKLEATSNDFLRLNDIYAEVKTQVNSLKRQYKKAERYQKVVDDIKDWELFLNGSRIKNIENEKREVTARLEELSNRRTNKETELDRISAELEADRILQIDQEHQLSEISNKVYEISEKAHGFENEISVLREKRTNARTLIERNGDEIKAIEARSEIINGQIKDEETILEDNKSELETLSTQLKDAEEKQSEADKALLQVRITKEDVNQQLLVLEGKISSGKTEEDNLHNLENELKEHIEQLKKQINDNQLSRTPLKEKAEQLELTLRSLVEKKTENENKLTRVNTDLEEKIENGEELSLEIANLTASIEACLARKSLLEDMILHYEGYESGVVATMEAKEQWPGLAGTVADKFIPVEGLEVAVEAALGELAQFVICENRKTAEDVIGFLKKEKKGRIGILVPDSGTLNPVVKRPELDLPEFIGWLDSYVSTDEKLRPLMRAVLSRVAVFKDGYEPTNLLEHLPYGFKAVSTSGTVYGKNIISGGSDDQFPLFRRKEKVAEQDKTALQLKEKLDSLNEQKNRNTANIASLRAESSQIVSSLETIDEESKSVQEQLNENNYRLKSTDDEINRLERELRQNSDKLESLRHRQYTLELDSNQLSGKKEDLILNISRNKSQLEEIEKAATEGQMFVSNLQVKTVETKSRRDQTESKIVHLNELLQELQRSSETKTAEIVHAKEEIENNGRQMTGLEEELKKTFEQRQTLTDQQGKLRIVQSDLLEQIKEKEKLLKNIRSEKDSFNEQEHQFEIRQTTLNSEANSIVDRIKEDYNVDLRQIELINPDDTLSNQDALNHLQEHKEKLKNFGAVNLLALEEYQTASEREKFLREQIDDLSTAKKDLQETINKINNTAQQLFNDTFEQVKDNFRKLFVDLFNGGEANIALAEPDQPLESDIIINARPRGKKLLSITMMSGGERALTAIALLFSLYLVKPSPFCILDEIDAPLDDANCRRFLKIIRNFSNHTQFITITHNKITMEAANNLYGITMEQPGISKLVAVKFNDTAGEPAHAEDLIDTEVSRDIMVERSDENKESLPDKPEEGDLPEKVIERITPDITTPVDDDNPK